MSKPNRNITLLKSTLIFIVDIGKVIMSFSNS